MIHLRSHLLISIYKHCVTSLHHSIPTRCYSKVNNYIFTMQNIYLRHTEGDNEFHVTFNLQYDKFGINQQCNMCRKLGETGATFTRRIDANVNKLIEKKTKKLLKKAEKEGKTLVIPQPNSQILIDQTPVPDYFICQQLFDVSNKYLLRLLDLEFNICINAPWIEKISLPDSVMSGFPIYPSQFDTFHVNRDDSSFQWFRSNNTEWELCGSGFYYLTSSEDIGKKLKLICIPKNKDQVGPGYEVVMDSVVEAGPGLCPFETRQQFTTRKTNAKELRVVSYNILADLYAASDDAKELLFSYCPMYALSFAYRKQLLLKELIGYNADLICLQEVDKKFFKYDLHEMLTLNNLEGVITVKGGTVSEGVACFYSTSKFKLLTNTEIIIGEELEKDMFREYWEKIKENEKLAERIKCKPTVVQCVVLQSLEVQNEILVVGNTHLYFHPDADHIRLLQGILAFTFLQHCADTIKQENPGKRISLIFCGDFNSVPECGIYKFVTTGNVGQDCIDWNSCPGEEITGIDFTHAYKMNSACGTPKYTNYTVGFKDCLDYIYYQTDALEVREVVPLPTEEELSANQAIPSVVFPSDHIPLIATLKFT